MENIIIKDPIKPWWPGDKRVDQYMSPVIDALDRQNIKGPVRTDIYNRAYESVYNAIKGKCPYLRCPFADKCDSLCCWAGGNHEEVNYGAT